jgi:DNA-binding MarR family transcriptional regulator
MQKSEKLRDFRRMIRIFEREFATELTVETSCCGVTLAQCHALLELDAAGEVSLSGLAEMAGLDKSTLSRTIESLVRDNLVNRTTDSDDRRAVCISLSAMGKERASAINEMCDEYYGKLLSEIPVSSHAAVIETLGLIGNAMTKIRLRGSCCAEKENPNG